MQLTVVQVRALNTLAEMFPGLTTLNVRDDEGVVHVVVRFGVGGGWMVDPPNPECASLGHNGNPCTYCGEEL
jgi:hypothetical protein